MEPGNPTACSADFIGTHRDSSSLLHVFGGRVHRNLFALSIRCTTSSIEKEYRVCSVFNKDPLFYKGVLTRSSTVQEERTLYAGSELI